MAELGAASLESSALVSSLPALLSLSCQMSGLGTQHLFGDKRCGQPSATQLREPARPGRMKMVITQHTLPRLNPQVPRAGRIRGAVSRCWHCSSKSCPTAPQSLVVRVSLGAVSGSGAVLSPYPWSSQQPSLDWEPLGHPHSCRAVTALQHTAPAGPSHLGDSSRTQAGAAKPHALLQIAAWPGPSSGTWLHPPAKPTAFRWSRFSIPLRNCALGDASQPPQEAAVGTGPTAIAKLIAGLNGS